MHKVAQNRLKLSLGLLLFLVGQLFSIAHAAEHGTDAHEHNGVVCVVAVSDDATGLLPEASLAVESFPRVSSLLPVLAAPVHGAAQALLLPPPTGPPSI